MRVFVIDYMICNYGFIFVNIVMIFLLKIKLEVDVYKNFLLKVV